MTYGEMESKNILEHRSKCTAECKNSADGHTCRARIETEDGHVDMSIGGWRERESGVNQDNRIDIFILPCEKQLERTCYIAQGARLGAL